MGGPLVRSDPNNTVDVYEHEGVAEIFRESGWLYYFMCLRGFNESIALEFAMMLQNQTATVRGIKIPVSVPIIEKVTGFPEDGELWFQRRSSSATLREEFTRGTSEELVGSDKGVLRSSLIEPWRHVAYIVQKFLTCEGRFKLLFGYHFWLLIHLRHHRYVNVPYFLFHSLQLMSNKAKGSPRPENSVTNHGLIKLIVMEALMNTKWTWITLIEGIDEELEETENVDGEIKNIEHSDKPFEKIHDEVGPSRPRRKSQIMKKGTVENPSQRRMKKRWSDKRSEEEMSEEEMMQEEDQLEYSPEKEEISPIQQKEAISIS
jgi:hypothetical protein